MHRPQLSFLWRDYSGKNLWGLNYFVHMIIQSVTYFLSHSYFFSYIYILDLFLETSHSFEIWLLYLAHSCTFTEKHSNSYRFGACVPPIRMFCKERHAYVIPSMFNAFTMSYTNTLNDRSRYGLWYSVTKRGILSRRLFLLPRLLVPHVCCLSVPFIYLFPCLDTDILQHKRPWTALSIVSDYIV